MDGDAPLIKLYEGRIPACGIYCGGCPVFVREKRACPGAQINAARCERCKSFHLCCTGRGITHCWQCGGFPCARFRRFAANWLKYGQDMTENQRVLAELGEQGIREYFFKLIHSGK